MVTRSGLRLPFDTLLCHLGELGCVSADLTFLGYCLARKLRTSLAAAERARGRKKWGGSGALSTELFGTIHLLQVGKGRGTQDWAGMLQVENCVLNDSWLTSMI